MDNDAGGITTYSLAGAHFGLSLLWSLIPITIVLIVVQEMGARMGVVTGKGLSDLIRERFGAKITFYLMMALIITNMGNTIAEFAGVAASMEVFGVKKYISVPASALIVWYLVIKRNYRSIEKVFLVACLFYLTYVISGIIVAPNWNVTLSALVKPKIDFEMKYVIALTAMVGASIAPWMQFYLQSSVVEKGIKIEQYKYSKIDVIIGSVTVNVIAFFIIVACAATLFLKGIRIHSAKDAALALSPLVGEHCSWLFAFGLLNASLFAASILPLSTAYYVCEGLGWETGVNKKFVEAPQFYILYSVMIIIGAGVILTPHVPLVPVMFLSQVINAILLPFILVCMVILSNDKKIMGNYTNGKLFNAVIWTATILISCLCVGMLLFSINS